MTVREPILNPVPIADLRPTQITVGMREVEAKRRAWREKAGRKGGEFLGQHMIPVIVGPKGRPYIIDHHHLARALLEEDVPSVLISVIADLERLEADEFWSVMDNRNWMHPFDDHGKRQDAAEIQNRSRRWWTIRSARLRANCGARAALPRTRRRFRSFCGRIFCAGG